MKKTLKKRLIAIIAAAVMLTVAFLIFGFGRSAYRDGSSEEKRIEYISFLGYEAGGAPDVKNIVIPLEFGEVYSRYNELQKHAGFDLSLYRGETAVQYSYLLKNYTDENGERLSDIHLNLIVSGGKIIGGDISSAALDGFMLPLSPKEKAEE